MSQPGEDTLGVGIEFFRTIRGDGYVSCSYLPPTIPGLMELPQPSPDENDTDSAREQRSLAVLNEVRWRPAHGPGTFRVTCQQRPLGYGVGSKRITDWGHRSCAMRTLSAPGCGPTS